MASHKYQNEKHVKTEQSRLRKGAYVGYKTLASIDQSLSGCSLHRERHRVQTLAADSRSYSSNVQTAVTDSHYLKWVGRRVSCYVAVVLNISRFTITTISTISNGGYSFCISNVSHSRARCIPNVLHYLLANLHNCFVWNALSSPSKKIQLIWT